MKCYNAKNIFLSPEFPLACTLAQQHESMVPHCHDFVEIVLITKGCTTHVFGRSGTEERISRLIRGDLFSILPGEQHSYRSSSNFQIYNLAMDLSILGDDLKPLLNIDGCRQLLDRNVQERGQRFYLLPRQRQEAMNLFQQMSQNGQPRDPVRRLEQKILLTRFLLALQRSELPQRGELDVADKHNFLAAVDRIEQGFADNDSLDDLARTAGMSVSGFTANFRREFGLSVGEYRQILRLDYASDLLLNTAMSVEEIAIESGFYDSNHFIKIYRRHFGTPPARFRKFQKY